MWSKGTDWALLVVGYVLLIFMVIGISYGAKRFWDGVGKRMAWSVKGVARK
jgi:hypothetical protein